MIILPKLVIRILTFGNDAITLSSRLTLISSEYESDKVLIRHERIHQAQAKELGWRYLPVYLKEWARAGFSYRQNRMKIEAYRFQAAQGYLVARIPFYWKNL